ncbi:MAG: hypothetical protein KKG92_02625 [Gammaproteobacteria bacterium]|nr:hypothetical protein [Gammaproteobacteria bacterium]
METDIRKKDGPFVAGREKDAVAASQGGDSKVNDIRTSVEAWNMSGDRPRDVSIFQRASLVTNTEELLEGAGV